MNKPDKCTDCEYLAQWLISGKVKKWCKVSKLHRSPDNPNEDRPSWCPLGDT